MRVNPNDEILGPLALFQKGAEPETLVINFSFRHVTPPSFSQYGAYDVLPYSRLFLNSPKEDWYLNGVQPFGDTLEATVAALKRFIAERGIRRVCTTGLSMGGYAALLYGRLLEADAILAFGPEVVLNLPFGRSHASLGGHAPSDYVSLVPRFPTWREHRRVHIIVGAEDLSDVFNGLVHRQILRGHVHFLPCDHSTVRYLQQRRLIAEVFRQAIDGEALTVLEPHEVVIADLDSLNAYDALAPLDTGTMQAYCGELYERLKATPLIAWHYADALKSEGRDAEALDAFRTAARGDPDNWPSHLQYGRMCVRLKQYDEAAAVGARLTAAVPDEGNYWQLLAMAEAGRGRHDAALAAAERAVERDPAHAAYRDSLRRQTA